MIQFKAVKAQLAPFKHKVLAVSGGIDSMVMADIMVRIFPKDELYIAYFEHNPDSPRGEKEFIQEVIRARKRWRDLPFYCGEFIPSPEPYSFEALARTERYDFLTEVSKRVKADDETSCVVTAHHLDDQLETHLFRLFTNRHISGIQPTMEWKFVHPALQLRFSEDLYTFVVRPFLDVEKEEVHDWADRNQLPFSPDPTNLDSDYCDRNFIRNEILPQLVKRFGNQYHLIDRLSK